MKTTTLFAVSLTSLLAGSVAYADDTDSLDASFDHHVAAPANAIELGIGTGYTQGAGPLGGGINQHLEDVSRAGGAVELDAMYRINPMFAVGAYGSFSQYATGNQIDDQTDVYGATAGVQGTLHLRADRSVDPWVSVGTGWRGLWLSPQSGKNTSLQGLELARLQIGADYRVDQNISITPVIGASLNMYVSEDSPMTTKFTEIDDKKVNFVGFAGLAGRFDLGGSR
ncbi:MAG TPA: hypothetical protein VGG28_22625 [Kofleriaceae bacterium]|jgi:hypothetical protein